MQKSKVIKLNYYTKRWKCNCNYIFIKNLSYFTKKLKKKYQKTIETFPESRPWTKENNTFVKQIKEGVVCYLTGVRTKLAMISFELTHHMLPTFFFKNFAENY